MHSFFLFVVLNTLWSFSKTTEKIDFKYSTTPKIDLIFDTDANNEIDDQHALAYLLLNGNTFNLKAVTVNTTYNGGAIDAHYEEAKRIMMLCTTYGQFPLLKGVNGDFETIIQDLTPDHDGHQAVDYIISQARRSGSEKLLILAVGKLTNVALALKRAPEITNNIRVVWLGSNYPEPGEYNLENDIPAMNYVLNSSVTLEIVTVRYGKPTGTDVVRLTKSEGKNRLKGLGPKAAVPIIGRHGGQFTTFGDYATSLFAHIDYYGDPPSRALFDMAAVAIIKNPNWARKSQIPAPIMENKKWVNRPKNDRMIALWEDFNSKAIIGDLFKTLEDYTLVTPEKY